MHEAGTARSGRPSAAGALLLASAALLGLAGCAAAAFAGISLAPGAADPALQQLARRAQSGDKQAQLELGIAYEEGRGVPVDLARAERLYRMAASDSGGTIYVYTPPVGRHGQGRVVPVSRGVGQPGLAEAKARLEKSR
jgi:TPR repeat protein